MLLTTISRPVLSIMPVPYPVGGNQPSLICRCILLSNGPISCIRHSHEHWVTTDDCNAESLLKPSFRRDRPPPPSPFAEEEPQSSDGTGTNSASQGQTYTSMRNKQVCCLPVMYEIRVYLLYTLRKFRDEKKKNLSKLYCPVMIRGIMQRQMREVALFAAWDRSARRLIIVKTAHDSDNPKAQTPPYYMREGLCTA